MSLADLLRQTLDNLDSGPRLSEKIRKGNQGAVVGPLDYNGQKVAMKVFNYTGRPDVARAIKEFQREYQSLKALSHPSIIRFIAFDHIPADNAAYLRMQWASTELSDSDSSGAVDLEDIICHHDGLHSLRTKSFLPEVFIWHVLFHLSAALSHCHYGIKIQRKRIVEKTDTQAVLDRLTKKPPPYLRDLAIQHPRVSWVTERITFSVDTSHAPIIHRDIKPRNVLLCDPPWNDHDENWRGNVSIGDDDIFCVYPVVLLGDFGLSVPLQVAETLVGSYGFTAPEIPLGSYRPDSLPFEWTTSCDIFSLGATIWNLMSLQTPPSSLNGCNSLPELPTSYSRELRELVLECCIVDQSVRRRPTAVDILDKCIQRGYWNETLQSWHDCLCQLNLLSGQSSTLVNQTPAIVDNSLSFMKLDQEDKYGRFSIFIAGAYFMRNVIYNTHFLVPLPRSSHFVGRQYELRILHSRINSSSDDQVVLSLCGMGGIGKTQIAIQFAHQVMERDTGISVFWVNGASLSAVKESYYRIAVECDILSTGRLDSFFMFRVKRWLESESAGRWLMIVDNVDDADSFLNAEDVACNAPFAYMPKCSHGSILYTTRDPQFAKQVSLSNDVVQVSNLTELESITLLNKIVSSHTNFESSDVLSSPDDLVLLSKELGHHPLAIAQAATYMNTFHLPVSEYLRYFEDQQTARRLLKFEAPDFTRDKGWESLYSTWKISFDRIQEKNTLAADVLALMSFLDPDAIPMFLLAREFTDKLSLSEAISTLRAMSLISPNNEGRTYAIHRLIQLFMQNWLESQGSRPRFLSMSLHLLARLFPADQYEGYDTSSVLLPHATKVLSLEGVSEDDSLTRAELLDKVSQYELRLGRLQDAEKFAREAFRIKSRLLGSTGREAASCQVHLARVLLALGKYREARESATESFKSFQAIDSRSADILSSMDSLAEVLRHQGEYGEAEQMHLKTLRLKEKVLGESHPDTLTSMANLASTYRNQGRWEEAEQLEVQVMERSKAKLGEDHPDTLMSMNNLASTYHNQGRWELAEQLFVQVMETSKTKLGADHPSTLTSMNNLASTYMNQGRWEEAEQLEVQVMETSKTKLGADHPLTLTSMANLAYTLRSSGQRKAALLLMGECVSLCDRKLGPDHPHTMSFKSALNEWRGNGESPSFELIKAPTETKDHQILASPTEASEPVSKPDRHGRRKLFSRLFSRK